MAESSGGGRQRRKQLPGEEYLSRREGSSHWHIDITIAGQRVRESSGTADKAAAAAMATKAREALWRRVKLGEVPKLDMTLAEAWARYYAEVAKGTPYGEGAQRYHAALLIEHLGRDTRLSTLSDDKVAKLVQHFRTRPAPSAGFKDGVAPATINRYVTTLQTICRRANDVWGADVGQWTKARHAQKEPKGREVFLEHSQARALLDALVAHARPIVLFDLMTGLRKENAIGLRWEQVSLDLAQASLMQKGGKPLTITLVPAALSLLSSVEPDPAQRQGAVWRFGNPAVSCRCTVCGPKRNHGKPIRSIRRSFQTAAKAAGLRDDAAKRLRFHDLRHTVASWLLAESGDLKLVQEALGHADITTTARYAHLMPGRKAAALANATKGLFEPEAA